MALELHYSDWGEKTRGKKDPNSAFWIPREGRGATPRTQTWDGWAPQEKLGPDRLETFFNRSGKLTRVPGPIVTAQWARSGPQAF